jgi:tetratricopeptide (TPR) repeat protein
VARAGVYNTAEPPVGPAATAGAPKALPFRAFRDALENLLRIAVAQPESPLRARYLTQSRDLENRHRAGQASATDQANLGAYLIRLGRTAEAVEVLTRAAAQHRRDFMVLANLAAAHQDEGRLDRALEYSLQVRDVWPRAWPGLSQEQLTWYRHAEDHQLKLLRSRLAESRQGPARAPAGLDALFPVRFIGPSGQYEAGKLAPKERLALPPDALALVQQLVLWFPADTRLYWLLGEVLNAEGDVEGAAVVLDQCVGARRYNAPELRAHRRVVQEAALQAASQPVVPLGPGPEPAPEAPAGWNVDRRLIGAVGGGAILVVAVLGYLQWREFRRRRGGAALPRGR